VALGGFLGRLKDLFGKDKVYEGDKAPMSSPVPQEVPAVEESLDGFDASSMAYLDKQMDRLGIDPNERDAFTRNMYDWSRQVRNVESDNRPEAAAGKYDEFGNLTSGTSAKGVYQFTDASVDTARNRMLYADKQGRGYGNEFIQGISQNPSEWSDEQADAMFLSNMFAQTGSDKEIKRIGRGDEQARQDAYYQFHHTAPDEATISRVDKLMPNLNQPVDDLFAGNDKMNNAFPTK